MADTTTPATPAPSEPEQGGLLGRLRAWFKHEVEPDLIAVRTRVAALEANLAKLAPELSTLGTGVVALADAADPAAAPEVTALVDGIKAAAAKVSEIAKDLGAAGL